MAFRISRLISLRPSSSRPPCFSSVRNISAVHSTNHRHHHPSTRNILVTTNLLPTHHQQQVRYHRTDYEGPGKYTERETGSMFGGEQHDHSHEHQDTTHHQNQKDTVINEGEKEKLQQLLKVRYNRRSGSYSHRGYTIGIGGPGKDILSYPRSK